MFKFLELSSLREKSKVLFDGIGASVSEIFNSWQLRIALIVNLVLNLSLWVIALRINQIVSQQLVVLHYNVDFGVNYIGSVKMLYIIPLMSLIILVLNISVMAVLRKEIYFYYLLVSVSIICTLFLHVAIGTIYLVNFTQ